MQSSAVHDTVLHRNQIMNQGACSSAADHGPCLHGRQSVISTAACRLGHHRPWLLVAGCNPLLVASRLATSSRAMGPRPSRDMIAGHVRQVEIRRRFSRYLRVACLGFHSWPRSRPRRPPHFPPTRPRRGRGWWRRPEPAAGLHLSTLWRVENDPSLLVGFVGSRVHPCSLARSLFALADLLNPLESRNIRRAWWWNPNFLHNAPFVSLSLPPSPPSPYNGAVKRVVCVFFLCDGARVSTNVLYLRDGDYTRYQL
jgi:hypothetical protein